MKKLLILAVFIVVSLSAYSQKKYETTDTTNIHLGEQLVVACEGEQCDIIFQNKIIDSVFFGYSSKAKNVLTSLAIFGLPNVYIYKDYQGDGCPEAYHLLDISDTNDEDSTIPKVIDYFGNCGTLAKIQVKKNGDALEFQFQEDKEAKRKKVTYTYDCNTNEMGKN